MEGIKKGFVRKFLLVIIILSMTAVPVMSSQILYKSEDINKPSTVTNDKAYFFCRVEISGTGQYQRYGIEVINWGLVEGSVSIKAFYSRGSETNQIIYLDTYAGTESVYGVFHWFFGMKMQSNGQFKLSGFAIWGMIV